MSVVGELRHKYWSASLGEDGVWRCDDKDVLRILNAAHSPLEHHSPSQGAYGLKQLYDAAKELGASASVAKKVDRRTGGVF